MNDETSEEAATFSEDEAAALLKMTPRMLAERRRAGKIGCIKDGRFIAYTGKHLAEYRRAHQRHGAFSDEAPDTNTLLEAISKHLAKDIRRVTAVSQEAHRGLIVMDERRPWDPALPLSTIAVEYDFTGPEEEGLSRSERRNLLEAA